MKIPKMQPATFAVIASWIAIGLLGASYGAFLYAALLFHPAAVWAVIGYGVYYIALVVSRDAQVARQMAEFERQREALIAEMRREEKGADEADRFDPSAFISGLRGRMH